MTKKKNPRKAHVAKNKFEREYYQNSLDDSFELDKTVPDDSTTSSNSTTAHEKDEKGIPKKKKRPVSLSKRVKKIFKQQGGIIFIATLIISIIGWLFINDYNFNADLKVSQNQIHNVEKQISNFQQIGLISDKDYSALNQKVENIKNNYVKLSEFSRLDKDYEVLKISIEKDIERITTELKNIKEESP